jgi:type IV secretory pathway VirJ component
MFECSDGRRNGSPDRRVRFLMLRVSILSVGLACTAGTSSRVVAIHGRSCDLRVYGHASPRVAIVSSGDGGWIHLAPHVAATLAADGWEVFGFDSRAYLSGATGLTTGAVARDFLSLLQQTVDTGTRPVLIGVSEGAGLSVVAAADPDVRRLIRGVVAIGLGDRNELAWHWKDAVIYLTKGVPNEPLFNASEFLPLVAPAPAALLESTHDEFVPLAEARRLEAALKPPSRVWTIDAVDHRFSNSLPALDARIHEALVWIDSELR